LTYKTLLKQAATSILTLFQVQVGAENLVAFKPLTLSILLQ